MTQTQKIGHYTIVGELGRGGMGVVYKAHEESLNRFVALKVLGEHLTSDETFLTRFTREAQAAAALSHPNIIQVYFIGQDAGKHFFVMEFVQGESLLDLVRKEGRIDNPRAAEFVVQAAAGLASAHDLGVLHRDIKPANLMVTTKGLVKIADFGLALPMEAATRLTATGMLMGTPGYLSPEQCRGEKVDHRTDIYSLGVTYYELLTGRMPYQADSPLALIRKILEQDPPDVATINQTVDPDARAILLKMIAKDREARYQTCHEVVADLEDYLAEHRARTGTRGVQRRTAAAVAPAPGNAATAGDAATVAATPAGGSFTDAPFAPSVYEDSATVAAPAPGPAAVAAATERIAPPAIAAPAPDAPLPPPAPPPSALAQRPQDAPVPAHAAVPAQRRSRARVALLAVILVIVAVAAIAGVAAMVSPQARTSVARLIPGLGGGRAQTAAIVAQDSPAAAADIGPSGPDSGTAPATGEPGAAQAAALGMAVAPAVPGGSEGVVPPVRQAEAAARRDEEAPVRPPTAAVPDPAHRPTSQPAPSTTAVLAQPLHGTTVVVTGERLLAGFVETLLEGEVAGHGSSLVDIETLPAADALVRGRESVSPAELLPVLRQDGVARLLLARVEYVSSRDLSYMGRRDTAYSSRITVTVYDVASGRPTGRSISEMVEYTSLNAGRQVEQTLLPRSQDILRLLD